LKIPKPHQGLETAISRRKPPHVSRKEIPKTLSGIETGKSGGKLKILDPERRKRI
jgi:hypothetical protein